MRPGKGTSKVPPEFRGGEALRFGVKERFMKKVTYEEGLERQVGLEGRTSHLKERLSKERLGNKN